MFRPRVIPSHSLRLWRDTRVLRVVGQAVFLAAVAAGAWWLLVNLQANLRSSGLNLSFRFLRHTAGFPISEGIRYSPTDSNGHAFWVGFVNTARIAAIGIVLATVVGVLVGVARLSANWLVRKLAALYVEAIRNIPLPVQLFFWYFAVILTGLPAASNSIRLPGAIYLSRRGLCMPWLIPTASFATWRWFLVGGAVSAVVVYAFRRLQLKRIDRPGIPILWSVATLLLAGTVGWCITAGRPLALDVPVFERFNFEGGIWLSASFLALLVGLTTYTGAFIAEIVRAGIQAVDRGQVEAAKALGLRRRNLLRLVVLPQAMRVILPPLGSQYLSLAKNSSLGILIGYYDLLNVSTTIFNQTGRAVEMMLLIMGSYLSLSFLFSFTLNYYNRRMQPVEK